MSLELTPSLSQKVKEFTTSKSKRTSFIEDRAERECPCLKKKAVPGSKERNTGRGVARAES